VVVHNVTIIGRTDLVAGMASDASRMYSKNITAFLGGIMKDGALNLDLEDEIVHNTLVTHEGKIVHEVTRLALERQA
jgi:NAD(P) transhydrogenase subunit alpha